MTGRSSGMRDRLESVWRTSLMLNSFPVEMNLNFVDLSCWAHPQSSSLRNRRLRRVVIEVVVRSNPKPPFPTASVHGRMRVELHALQLQLDQGRPWCRGFAPYLSP